MAEGEPARVRSDSNGQGDPWPVNLSISTTSSGQMMASSGGSDRLDAAEVPSPPLALISSRVKSANALETCANLETATVRYAYETTSPSRLLRAVGEKLRGRKALSVALVVHGSPGCFKLCSQKVWAASSPMVSLYSQKSTISTTRYNIFSVVYDQTACTLNSG